MMTDKPATTEFMITKVLFGNLSLYPLSNQLNPLVFLFNITFSGTMNDELTSELLLFPFDFCFFFLDACAKRDRMTNRSSYGE